MRKRLNVWYIGDPRIREFRAAYEQLHQLTDVTDLPDLAEAIQHASPQYRSVLQHRDSSPELPDLLLLAESYPGQWLAVDVERLRQHSPLTRMVLLAGTWCEGEARSGHPPLGTLRIYWHRWTQFARVELTRLAESKSSVWHLPPTSGDDDLILMLSQRKPPKHWKKLRDKKTSKPSNGIVQSQADAQHRDIVLISSRSREFRDLLTDICTSHKLTTRVWPPRIPGQIASRYQESEQPVDRTVAYQRPLAAIIEMDDVTNRRLEQVKRIRSEHPAARLIAIAGFPRLKDRDRLLKAGADAMLSKPLLISDLVGLIRGV